MQSLFNDCHHALSELQGVKPSIFDMMAICWTESLGQFFYDCQNCLMKKRMSEMESVTGIKTYELLNALRCGKGENAHKIPRFVFDAGAYMFLKNRKLQGEWSDVDIAMASCGIGVYTRFHSDMAKVYSIEDFRLYIDRFKRSPHWQLQQLAHDLSAVGAGGTHADLRIIQKFYNEPEQHQANDHKSPRVVALSSEYAMWYDINEREACTKLDKLNVDEVSVKSQ